MMPGHNAANILVHQQFQKYRNDLDTWSRQVRATRSFYDALRAASHKPVPGNLIRSLTGMMSSDKARAERLIEEGLLSQVENVKTDDPTFHTYMRLAQGHWPRVYRALDRKRQNV